MSVEYFSTGRERTEMNKKRAQRNMLLLGGSTHPELARQIANKLQMDLCPSKVFKYKNGETNVEIEWSVRGADVYIIQTGAGNINDSLMEMMIMAYACRSASAHNVIGVLPYMPYSKQCKMRKRGSIVAKLMAQSLSKAGFDHIITLDLHQKEVQGYFDCPVENLRASPFLIRELQSRFEKINGQTVCVVARTPGFAKRAQSFAERMGVALAVIHGEGLHQDEHHEDGRSSPPPQEVDSSDSAEPWENQRSRTSSNDPPYSSHARRGSGDGPSMRSRTASEAAKSNTRRVRTQSNNFSYDGLPMLGPKQKPALSIVGGVVGKTCIIVEDIIDEAKPFCECAKMLKKEGAKRVIVLCTHAVMSGDAPRDIEDSQIDEVIVSNSIPHNEKKQFSKKICTVDIAFLMSEAIRRIHHGESMSYMFKDVTTDD